MCSHTRTRTHTPFLLLLDPPPSRYDVDALGVVLEQGLSCRLLVLDPGSMMLREQLECMDTLHASASGLGRGQGCSDCLVGSAARVLLLGEGVCYS